MTIDNSGDIKCIDINASEIHNDTDISCTCFTHVSGHDGSVGLDCESLASDSSITLGRMPELDPWLKSNCDSTLFTVLNDWDYRGVCIGNESKSERNKRLLLFLKSSEDVPELEDKAIFRIDNWENWINFIDGMSV